MRHDTELMARGITLRGFAVFADGDADHLDRGVREDHALDEHDGGEQAVGQHAAVVGDQLRARAVAVDGV